MMMKRVFGVLAATALAASLASCSFSVSTSGNAEPWPQDQQDEFLSNCEIGSNGQTAYCECALDKYMSKVSSADLAEHEQAVADGESDAVAQMQQIIKACQHLAE